MLVGEAAVHLGGKPYTRLLAQELTEPLEMPHTGMLCQTPHPDCAVAVDSRGEPGRLPVGLWTTARDMLRFVEANLGVLTSPPLLTHALDITHKELFRVDRDHAVGMAWEEWHRGDDLLISKDGEDSGFGSWIGFEPHRQCGVVVLRNGGAKPGAGMLGRQLLALASRNG